MSKDKTISIIIPVYNDQKRLRENLNTIKDFCRHELKAKDYEIIFVSDGSTDNTDSLIQGHEKTKAITYKKNRGKGFAVRKGMTEASKDIHIFLDCDLSTPLREVNNFLENIDKYDIIIGSRHAVGSDTEQRFHKRFLGKLSNIAIRLLAVKGIRDTQCGFKMFNKKASENIFSRTTIDRWGIDFEILHIAQKHNLSIKEQPIEWHEDTESKVKARDYITTLGELIKIKINSILGKYE